MTSIKPHPLNVKPKGNELLNTSFQRTETLGKLGLLNDDVLLSVIQDLDMMSLLKLSHTCKSLYAYCWYDEIWKFHVYNQHKVPEKWRGSWRKTCLELDEEALIDCTNKVYSDILFRPFQLSQINYNEIIKHLDEFQIPVYDENNLSFDIFKTRLYKRPFIAKLSKPIAEWTAQTLIDKFGNEVFRQEYMDWPLRLYAEYMQANVDETPLYLFDCKSKAHQALQFDQPLTNVFGLDYFTFLGSSRPDHQWLIMGPDRSGSGFHKDPNATSAWNSIVSGRKYWIMFPPNHPPPGVYTNETQSEVTAPVSLAEWFQSGFYLESLESPYFQHAITGPGECMYVPSGWWHAVVNLEECIAMTGNFVSEVHLEPVLKFLRDKQDQISGFKNPEKLYSLFNDIVEREAPFALKRKRTFKETIESDGVFKFGF